MYSNNNFDTNEQCANILKTLHESGISAIPLQGKRPHFSTKWKRYQTRLPEKAILEQWEKQQFDSYGIICGCVSQGIIVIDFDCLDLYTMFSGKFAQLANTYTVKTKRGFHVYLKTTFPVSSRHFDNCDIKGDGGYVVGAGSIINGYRYITDKNKAIQPISYKQYTTILEFLTPKPTQLPLPLPTLSKHDDLVKRYTELIPKLGRNNALYTVAREAHQHHISEQQVIKVLATIHENMPATPTHHIETPTQRLHEATKTIKSAYKTSIYLKSDAKDLPNSIREELLKKQSSTISVRLLDIIKLQNTSLTWITATELLKFAKPFHLSKRSILSVLTGDLAKINGKRLFKQIRYQDYIETNVSQGDRREPKSNVGRPTQYIYKIPDNNYLCNILHVTNSISDRLRPEDLYSAGAYRRALHRELIVRLSPMIRVDWYANRLSVHRRTIFRYNLQLGVTATPMIEKNILTLETAQSLPDNDNLETKGFTPGVWLETYTGKRYPALRSIANDLVIKIKTAVKICRQLPTRYTLSHLSAEDDYPIKLPDHLKSRSKLLTYSTIHEILSPDWATKKFDLGGYLAVYNGYEWTFRPPFRAIAYQLVKHYEEGLVYFVKPLKT
jgi:hypothetical protein